MRKKSENHMTYERFKTNGVRVSRDTKEKEPVMYARNVIKVCTGKV